MWHPTRAPLPVADLAIRSHTDGATLTLKAGPKSSQVVKKLAPGIYTYGKDAYRFFARVRKKLETQIFRPPIPMSLVGVKEAYKQWRNAIIDGPAKPVHKGTLAGDVEEYLSRVTAMPTFKTRAVELRRWATLLGPDRPRASIDAAEIEQHLQRWLSEGYAAQTVRHRRTALIQVWKKLDGKHAKNPAREAEPPPKPPDEARDIPLDVVEDVFAAMRPCKSKTFLWVILTTGLPHKQIYALEPDHFDERRRRVYATPRRKGAGAAGGWRDLTDEGVEALRAFMALGKARRVNRSSVYRTFRRACAKASATLTRPYDLRHTFGTWSYDALGDLNATAFLLGHASLTTTKRYTLGARQSVSKKAVAAMTMPKGLGAKVDRAVAYGVTPAVTRRTDMRLPANRLAAKGNPPL
jgi:integrase